MIEQPEKRNFFEGAQEGRPQRSPQAQRYYEAIAKEHRPRFEGPVSPARREVADPAAMAGEIKGLARRLGADLVGICRVTQDHVYKTKAIPEKYAISLGMEMDYDRIATAPSPLAATEVARAYHDLGLVTIELAEHIRERGYPASVHHPLGAGRMVLVPFAILAGLGEQGRSGIAVSREFGPRFRLGCVTTDLPLAVDGPVDLGVARYCEHCKVCMRACPAGAIPEQRTVHRGIERWVIDVDRCRPYFLDNHGCGICIKVCVYNKMSHAGRWLARVSAGRPSRV